MQSSIHPKFEEIEVTCSCGNVFRTYSTHKDQALKIDICNACHPFYTGKQKIIDTEGRVDMYMRRYGLAQPQNQANNDDENKSS